MMPFVLVISTSKVYVPATRLLTVGEIEPPPVMPAVEGPLTWNHLQVATDRPFTVATPAIFQLLVGRLMYTSGPASTVKVVVEAAFTVTFAWSELDFPDLLVIT